MMDAVDFLKTKAKMSNSCRVDCFRCAFNSNNNKYSITCGELMRDHPDKAVEIAQDWRDKNES